jgi:hypothetical protein
MKSVVVDFKTCKIHNFTLLVKETIQTLAKYDYSIPVLKITKQLL